MTYDDWKAREPEYDGCREDEREENATCAMCGTLYPAESGIDVDILTGTRVCSQTCERNYLAARDDEEEVA